MDQTVEKSYDSVKRELNLGPTFENKIVKYEEDSPIDRFIKEQEAGGSQSLTLEEARERAGRFFIETTKFRYEHIHRRFRTPELDASFPYTCTASRQPSIQGPNQSINSTVLRNFPLDSEESESMQFIDLVFTHDEVLKHTQFPQDASVFGKHSQVLESTQNVSQDMDTSQNASQLMDFSLDELKIVETTQDDSELMDMALSQTMGMALSQVMGAIRVSSCLFGDNIREVMKSKKPRAFEVPQRFIVKGDSKKEST
ncbi:hypothetical protein M3Y97_00373600 [Aphelenchoides bicaudatus]|nr:hypothetical protein M3Y97_00373600 [Aphelenchoides bicaudatus]